MVEEEEAVAKEEDKDAAKKRKMIKDYQRETKAPHRQRGRNRGRQGNGTSTNVQGFRPRTASSSSIIIVNQRHPKY